MKTLRPFSPLRRDYALRENPCKACDIRLLTLAWQVSSRRKDGHQEEKRGGRGKILENPWYCKGSTGFYRGNLTLRGKIGRKIRWKTGHAAHATLTAYRSKNTKPVYASKANTMSTTGAKAILANVGKKQNTPPKWRALHWTLKI